MDVHLSDQFSEKTCSFEYMYTFLSFRYRKEIERDRTRKKNTERDKERSNEIERDGKRWNEIERDRTR